MSIHPNYSTSYHSTFFIDGMTSSSCVERIKQGLATLDDISSIDIQLSQKIATVYSHRPIHSNRVMEIVAELGFQPSAPQNFHLSIQGMSCAGCVRKVEQKLLNMKGVTTVFIHPTRHHARIQAHYQVQLDDIFQTIQQCGYQADIIQPEIDQQEQLEYRQHDEVHRLKADTILAVIFTLPIFILEMGGHLFSGLHHQLLMSLANVGLGQTHLFIIEWFLASIVLWFAGRRFFIQGLPALFRFSPDMNSLVAIGAFSAYAYSMVATFAPQLLPSGTVFVYYEATTVIISLILLGRYLEAKAKIKVSSAINRLLNLQVKTAHVYQQQRWIDVEIDDIQVNDIVEVRAGERIPVDGIVLDGHGDVDESMLTGEAMPITKYANDRVYAGTLHQQGLLHVKATHTAQTSTLAQMIALVEQAQQYKLPIQHVADKITLYFVPAILVLALITLCAWLMFAPELGVHFALVNMVAVLIVACPCAMGLATPMSIMLGLHRGAEQGILFRQGEALQQLKQCQSIIFDKTGTLTEGKPSLTDFQVLKDDIDEQEAFQWLASIEAKSNHPIAQAIVQSAQDMGLGLYELDHVETLAGNGLIGYIEHLRIDVGAEHYMQQLNIDTSPHNAQLQLWREEGKTVFFMAVQQQIIAILAVADKLRPESIQAVQQLKQRGFKIALLTGDHHYTAQHISKQLGIDQVLANVSPADKLEYIKEQQKFGKVAFVGDGINDAPALAQADVGIAIGTGTDIAIESADVILMSPQLTAVSQAVQLSQATIQNIYQNLFWAFIYNITLIPIAMGLFYMSFGWLMSPMFSAFAMAFSSVFVIVNALRLKYMRLTG